MSSCRLLSHQYNKLCNKYVAPFSFTLCVYSRVRTFQHSIHFLLSIKFYYYYNIVAFKALSVDLSTFLGALSKEIPKKSQKGRRRSSS